jgi:hypothetical protein
MEIGPSQGLSTQDNTLKKNFRRTFMALTEFGMTILIFKRSKTIGTLDNVIILKLASEVFCDRPYIYTVFFPSRPLHSEDGGNMEL